jgi:hypothetical protein
MTHEVIRQLVYISRAMIPFSLEDLQMLSTRAEARNKSADIGGALLYGSGLFLQALEGETDGVDEVLGRIRLDPRHREVQILVDHQVKARSFRKWAMTPIALDGKIGWTAEHVAAVERMAGVATVAPPGSAAHSLIGSFTKQIPRLCAA